MPVMNLRKELYDELIRMGEVPKDYVNDLVKKNLRNRQSLGANHH